MKRIIKMKTKDNYNVNFKSYIESKDELLNEYKAALTKAVKMLVRMCNNCPLGYFTDNRIDNEINQIVIKHDCENCKNNKDYECWLKWTMKGE